MNNLSKILIAFGAGAVAGAALGLLFAPDKGTDTRRKISEQGKKIVDNVTDTIGKLKEQAMNQQEVAVD